MRSSDHGASRADGMCTFFDHTSGDTAEARAYFEPSGSTGTRPGTVRCSALITAGPFALFSTSFAVDWGHFADIAVIASHVWVKFMRARTWSSR